MCLKLSKLFINISIIIFSLMLLLYLITNNFIFLLLALFLSFKIAKNTNIKKFGLVLFCVSFIIRLFTIIIIDFPQVYDFATLLDASKMFAHGDFSFNTWWHFYTWGYQTGFVIYQGFILKLFNSVFLLKLLNVIYSSFLVLFVYKLSLKISDEKSARIVSLLYMIFPFYIFLDTVLVNHHLATLLMYGGIIFLIKKDKTYIDYVFSAILIAFGNIIRPEGIIVVLSLLFYEFLLFDRKKIKLVLVRLLSFLIIYFSICSFASLLVIKTGVNPSGLKNKDPLWKFVLGFNYDSCGYYVDSDSQYQIDRDTELNIIKERALSNLPRTGNLLLCKINRFWLSPSLDMEMGSFSSKEINFLGLNIKFSNIGKIVTDFNSYIQILVLSLFVLGIFVYRKSLSNISLFLLIMCMVTFGVFLFIEIQPRYAYFIHISVFILSSLGIKYMYSFLSKYNINFLKKVL